MCFKGAESGEWWQPVSLKRGWAALRRWVTRNGKLDGSMRVRILCGAYELSSPFIEGGCATDWLEDLGTVDERLKCPGCGKCCPEDVVGCAREMLASRVVFVFGCSHHAFTFSRRQKEPYFCAEMPGAPEED